MVYETIPLEVTVYVSKHQLFQISECEKCGKVTAELMGRLEYETRWSRKQGNRWKNGRVAEDISTEGRVQIWKLMRTNRRMDGIRIETRTSRSFLLILKKGMRKGT